MAKESILYRMADENVTYRNRAVLEELYNEEGLSQSEIAERFGVNQSTISDWMNKHDIDAEDRDDPKERLHRKSTVNEETGCWEWSGFVKESNGYGESSLNGFTMYVHRMSYKLHKGSIPEGKWVLHKCHNKTCVNPEHLYLGNVQDNVQDAMEEGSFWHDGQLKNGEENVSSKLTEEEVREIRELYDTTGMTQQDLADQFSTAVGNVNRIVNRVTWTHI
jgi:DNA-binding MarR family transcriptional regulator